MAEPARNPAYEVVWLIRRLFRAMGDTADRYLKDDELTAANRAVMEFLYPEEKLSVPTIANKYRVSRQHVQVTANQLLAKGLIRAVANPDHKRSPLLRLSKLGRDTFAEIRHNESAVIEKLFADLQQDDIEVTRNLLKSLLMRVESGELP
jgi:DNA-binding MarR family transcriptional regulator